MSSAKKYPEIIDLHMHTTVSDGTDKPEEIVALVREAGIGLFSVTDHDALEGCARVLEVLKEGDPKFITGVEFSCKDKLGKYHILGYGYDPEKKPIEEVVQKGHTLRMDKMARRVEFLEDQFGFTFPEKELKKLFRLDNPGKPHLGNLMVKYGYAPNKETAIKDFIDKMKPANAYVRPEEAIEGILGSGGIPVLAHPSYGSGEEIIVGEEMDARLKRLIEFGLQGVEAFYSGFTTKLVREMLTFADQYDLYVTAGSDYHGHNKMVELGDTGLVRTQDAPEALHRFLDKVLA